MHIHLKHKIAPVADCAIDTAEEIFGFFIIIEKTKTKDYNADFEFQNGAECSGCSFQRPEIYFS